MKTITLKTAVIIVVITTPILAISQYIFGHLITATLHQNPITEIIFGILFMIFITALFIYLNKDRKKVLEYMDKKIKEAKSQKTPKN